MLRYRKTKRFEKSYVICAKRNYDMRELKAIMKLLINEQPLPERCRNHKLKGTRYERWDCHIKGDWVLLYRYEKDTIIFEDTGTHSDLF